MNSQYGAVVICLEASEQGGQLYFNQGKWGLHLENYHCVSWVNYHADKTLVKEVNVCSKIYHKYMSYFGALLFRCAMLLHKT